MPRLHAPTRTLTPETTSPMDELPRSRLIRAVLFPSATAILTALLVVDTCLITGHILHDVWGRGPFSMTRFSLAYEDGFAELFGGGKILAAAAIMWALTRRSLAPIDLAWAVALAIVALDEIFELHEGFARLVDDAFDLPTPFGSDGLGELVVWALIGSIVSAMLIIAHKRSEQEPRNRSRRIAGIVALLIFFAVGVDAFNLFVLGGDGNGATHLIEEGGELVVMSLLLASVASFVI